MKMEAGHDLDEGNIGIKVFKLGNVAIVELSLPVLCLTEEENENIHVLNQANGQHGPSCGRLPSSDVPNSIDIAGRTEIKDGIALSAKREVEWNL